MKKSLLISACLAGVECRYDGGCKRVPELDALKARFELIPICPEQLGGLPTPRTPAERLGARVVTRAGGDVTDAFVKGAAQACRIAALCDARFALLKARSPSCGNAQIYDGSFSGRIVPGRGVACEALEGLGVAVFNEAQIERLLEVCGDDPI